MTAMLEEADDIPQTMRDACRWLVWKSIPVPGKKPRKVPFYANGQPRHGVLDTPEDWGQLATFEDASQALDSGQYTGLGFALGPDGTGNYWQGVDLDNIAAHADLRIIGDDLPGYTETSPSGQGMHAIGYGRPFPPLGSNGTGIEAYSAGRYFTVTGVEAGIGAPTCLAQFVDQVLRPRHGLNGAATIHTAEALDFATPTQLAELRSALASMRSDDRDLWVANGQRLKRLGERGRALWIEWSQQSDKFDPADAARVWDSLSADRTGFQAVFADAQRRGWLNPLSGSAPTPVRPAVFQPKATDPYWGFRFAPDMLECLGPTRWLISKLLPEDCTAVLYGPSGSLKSFVMIDMAMSVALGVPWQNKPTKQRTVFYLAGEGEQGFAKRLAAWCLFKGHKPPANFAFRQIPAIQDETQLEQLVETIRAICVERGAAGLIVIDTLFTALNGGDENSGKDMGLIISAMKRLRVEFGAAVVAVHHTGKVGEAARGHSSLPSGMDVMFYAKPGPTPLTVEVTNPKQKDGAEHPSMLLQATVYELPIEGEDGERETSLVLSDPSAALMDAYKSRTKVTEETSAKARGDADARTVGLGPNQAAAVEALTRLTKEERLADESVLRRVLQEDGMEKSAAWYAVRTLIQSGVIVKVGEILRLSDSEDT